VGARKRLTVGALALFGVGATASSAGADTQSGFTPEQTAQVDAATQGVMSSENVLGVNVGIYAPGKR